MKLYGKNQVIERLKVNPESIKKIYLNKTSTLGFIEDLALEKKIAYFYPSDNEFYELSQHYHTQGVIAEVEEFSYMDLEDLLVLPENEKYTLIALSNITDPQNLGSILRSLACLGRFALIIPKHRTARVNETVLKVACGGENYIPVVEVTNLIPALERIKKFGYWVAGGVVENGKDITQFEFPSLLCIVIGSEDKGIRNGIITHLDFQLTLPMLGKKLSLNAAVACAIFCYEVIRQRMRLKNVK